MPVAGPPATTSQMATNRRGGQNYVPPATSLNTSIGSSLHQGAAGTGPAVPQASPDMNLRGAVSDTLAANPSLIPRTPPTPVEEGDGTPSFLTPEMQRYINQFRSSQGAQQSAINAGLVQALQGLGERRDAAAKVANTLPAQYDERLKAHKANAARANTVADTAFGGRATPGENADKGVNIGRAASATAAGHATQPLLQAGITADESKGRTTLANTHMQNQASIAATQQEFDSRMALAAAEWGRGQDDKTAAYAHDREMAVLNSSLQTEQYKATHPNTGLTPQQEADLQRSTQRSTALDNEAIGSGFTSYQQYESARKEPAYQQAADVLMGKYGVEGDGWKIKKGDRSGILASIQNPLVIKALRKDGLITDAEIADLYGIKAG